jgi:hypothetical protein
MKMQKKGEGSSSAPPQFDTDNILTKEKEDRYKIISNWRIILERVVKLKQWEYPQITEELTRQGWGVLASPMEFYDPQLVLEFFTNTYSSKNRGSIDKSSGIRGVRGEYTRYALNEGLLLLQTNQLE